MVNFIKFQIDVFGTNYSITSWKDYSWLIIHPIQRGKIHHLNWQVGCTSVNLDPCILLLYSNCNDHPAFSFPFPQTISFFYCKMITTSIHLFYFLLTPSCVKLPAILHLSTMMFVSGKIALSQAPSLLNSSAKPCHHSFQSQISNFYSVISQYTRKIPIITSLKNSIGLFFHGLGTWNCSL